MMATELIAALQALVAAHGDRPVKGSWYDQDPYHDGSVTWIDVGEGVLYSDCFFIDGSRPL